MAEATASHIRLMRVQAIDPTMDGRVIHFVDGTVGRLSAVDDNFEWALRELRESLDLQKPVGICLGDEGAICQVHWVDSDVPLEVDEHEKDCVRIVFQCHAGLYHLKRDHPNYLQLLALLQKAWQEQRRVWFLADLPQLDLRDIQFVDAVQSLNGSASAVGIQADAPSPVPTASDGHHSTC